jgi:hypothetical protein
MFGDQAKFSFKRKIGQFTLWGAMFLVLACAREKVPAGVLSEPEMVAVLTDIYLTEEKARHAIASDSVKQVFPKFEAKIFEKAGTQDSVFRKSLEYYLAHPKQLENIYTALIDSLNLKAQSTSTRAE